jgi:hypothetical protein
MTTFETVDDAAWFLHAAGWSTAEARPLGAAGARWMVTANEGAQEVIATTPRPKHGARLRSSLPS